MVPHPEVLAVLMNTVSSFGNLNDTLVGSLSEVTNLQGPGKPKEGKEVIPEVFPLCPSHGCTIGGSSTCCSFTVIFSGVL